MKKEKTQSEIASAEKKSIGFDYQYYFFLWKLLSLETGESVGLEVKDDVHTELNNDEQIFYQIKHTIKKKADGSAANLTESDNDLWKTLSNWVKIITDKADDRADKNKQLAFIKKTCFVLASNKSSSDSNKIVKSIIDLHDNTITINNVKKTFNDFSKKCSNT